MNNKNQSYLIVNLIFVIIIGVVFSYSYFFYPNNQPVKCVHKQYTGQNCSSCGLSRAFSSFTHLNYAEGRDYNPHVLGCFAFFLFQFLLRGSIIAVYAVKPENLTQRFIVIEVVITIVFFLLVFSPFLYL